MGLTIADPAVDLEELVMARMKGSQPSRANDEIRHIMLRYFYDRNKNSTSSRGKKGSAVKISDIKS